ncbi:hypothetical protein AB0F81_34565 [Actinoplanes sp. NPDC024001]|uniref:hypothetical protein n=1 Tax=Actinoplanes sp. NPDC024001 TaxID=3154598 RepID=UPI0033E76CE5
MTKVKIGSDDHEAFAAAAAAADTTVGRWLVEAGRRQVLADAAVQGKPGARIVPVPVSAATGALLAEHADRSGIPDWAYAARLLHDVVSAPAVDPERLWSDVVTSINLMVESARQRACLDDLWIDTIVGSTVLLVAADAYTRDVVELRLRPMIAEALSRRLGRRVQVAVTIEQAPSPVRPARPQPSSPVRVRSEDLAQALQVARDLLDRLGSMAPAS